MSDANWEKLFDSWKAPEEKFELKLDRYCSICGANKPIELHETWCPNEPDRIAKDDPDFWLEDWSDEEADVCDTAYHAPEPPVGEDWGLRDKCLTEVTPILQGQPIYYNPVSYATGHPPAAETRITDPTTGGMKGSKLAQLGAVDPLALLEVAKVAGFGGKKYERYNFAKGYRWSLSYDALQRHLNAFWAGEDTDRESGLYHIAHAAWHCLALLTFSLRDLGTDDRFPR